MIILPAIDIKDGRCVRLQKGDFATTHQVADSPLAAANRFAADGAKWLHMVDLDGAKEGAVVNGPIILDIAQTVPISTEIGGGIRTLETVEYYLSGGISRVILGSAALKDPTFIKAAVGEYGEKIAVGIDARNGLVAAEGWLQTTSVSYLELAKAMGQIGVQHLIFTDIAKDGMLSGPNLIQLAALKETVSCHLIASGGIRDIGHIRDLCAMDIYGAICGKSLYEGTLQLQEAIAMGGTQ